MANIHELAQNCVLNADLDDKLAQTDELVARWKSGELKHGQGEVPVEIGYPGRPDAPEIVLPNRVKKRKLGSVQGRAALIHSLAHIELTAVDLAWDTIYRYPDMPRDFYADWVAAAGEEALHFRLLRRELLELSYDYGDFSAHGELWKMAVKTGHDLKDRMAIVHRVLEARALDIVPLTQKKFEALGAQGMVSALTRIANDEVGHVGAATHWFRYCCEQLDENADETFFALLKQYMGHSLKGPFNLAARKQSGFSDMELRRLQQGI